MNKKEVVKKIIKNNDGIAKTKCFVAEGITNYEVSNMCKEGYLERIRHGYYQLAEQNNIIEEQLLSSLLPECIICMESALFYYGYNDFSPRKWSIAVPRTFSRTRLHIDVFTTKVYYVQPTMFDLGKTIGNFNGIKLSVYDRERTICDCFKYRNKIDREIFNKAIKCYVKDKNKNLNNLSIYAKKMHVYKKMMEVMEVLLND